MNDVILLIDQAQSGNKEAFERLVLMYQDQVYASCMRLTNHYSDAEDLAQEVFVQAYIAIRSFRKEADFGTWLHRIAVNRWINICRKEKKIVTFSLDKSIATEDGDIERDIEDDGISLQEHIEQQDFGIRIHDALQQLDAEFRIVMVLRYLEEYSYQEIADHINVPLGTVKSRISRATKQLQQILRKASIEL